MMADDGSREGADVRRGSSGHISVLLSEVLDAAAPADGDVVVDATFGAGGYTRAILEAAACTVIAFDRDPSARLAAGRVAADFPARFAFIAAPFAELADYVETLVDAVVFDIGVSSMQLDDPARGFSFSGEGPLDMRMFAARGEAQERGPTAAELVNTLDEADLADIFFHLGEERRARRIAREIVRVRSERPLATTGELATLVARVLPRSPREAHHPATRTFQALRIAVNDELGQFAEGLLGAEKILKPGGRLVVVTFHSLEDRIAKRFFQLRSGRTAGASRHQPELRQLSVPTFRIVNHRPLTPGNEEIATNPRARSAKLRWGIRTEAEPSPLDVSALGLPRWRPSRSGSRGVR
jgi:16S rRNA (cytosine1402-N4)-methyltransferase